MAKSSSSTLVQLIGGGLLLVLIILLVGFSIVDWRGALAVLIGVVMAIGARRLVGWIRTGPTGNRRRLLLVAILGAGAIVIVCLVIAIGGLRPLAQDAGDAAEEPSNEAGEDVRPPVVVSIVNYRMVIVPGEDLKSEVLVQEEVVYSVTQGPAILLENAIFQFPERTAMSEPHGFILREIVIAPVESGARSRIRLPGPDGASIDTRLCAAVSCPPSSIRLDGFPKGAFYAARGIDEVDVQPYVNEEIVSWDTEDLTSGIVFAYIPPPYHSLRPALQPFVGAAGAQDWIVALFSLLGTLVAIPIVKPILEDLLADWVKERLKALFKRGETRKK